MNLKNYATHMRSLCLILVIAFASLLHCSAQKPPTVKLKRSDLEHDVPRGTARGIFPAQTDFRVLDGVLLAKGAANPEWVNTTQIKDRDELKTLGVTYPEKSYTFFNSEVSASYTSIYQLALIPLQLKGMNLPVIIDGYLFTAGDYSKTSHKTTAIRSVKFVPKGSEVLKKYQSVELGALEVTY